MSRCPKCGVPVEADARVCPACGVSMADATASFAPVGVEEGVSASDQTADGPALVVRKGPQPGERFFLEAPSLSMGRDPESDIFLNDMTVSREHARLAVADDGTVTVWDAGSLNGTYVNGECADSAVLHDGDVVQIGTFQMVFVAAEANSR